MKDLQWFRDRRRRMLPGELSNRVVTMATRKVWQFAPSVVRTANRSISTTPHRGSRTGVDRFVPFAHELQSSATAQARMQLIASPAAERLIEAADQLMGGNAEILGLPRRDLERPDWDLQPTPVLPNGLSHEVFPSAKHWWELSRANVLTQLAAATVVSGEARYLERASTLLVDWCKHFASPEGPMWESGVELGIRMQSWSWIRRLLLSEVTPASESSSRMTAGANASRPFSPFDDPAVRSSIINHLEILRLFPSSHSSANNHRLLEAAGLFCGGCSFADLVDEQVAADARETGLRILVEELQLQVTSSGLHREQAIDYHCFVLEAAFFALLEGELHGIDIPDHAWNAVHRMTDALHAMCDQHGLGPRFGDSDNSHVVQLDATFDPPTLRALTLMSTIVGGPCRDRNLPVDVRSAIVAAVADAALPPARRGLQRPIGSVTDRVRLAEDGLVVVHGETHSSKGPDVWLALRSGVLGYLPIAAHAHADLNSVEIRLDGVPLVIDPGTFGYGEDPFLRRVFRQTPAHSTVNVNGESQAEYAGPFLWSTDAIGTTDIRPQPTEHGTFEALTFTSTHDGFVRSFAGPLHERTVSVTETSIALTDRLLHSATLPPDPAHVSTTWDAEVHFLLHGDWNVEFADSVLVARHPHSTDFTVTVQLDESLHWQLHEADPSGHGWQAPAYGHLAKATSLRGRGNVATGHMIHTTFSWSPGPKQRA